MSGFLRTSKQNSRWFFPTPDNRPLRAVGLNHIDPSCKKALLHVKEAEEKTAEWHENAGKAEFGFSE